MNIPCSKAPSSLPFIEGTHGDLLTLTLHKIMMDGKVLHPTLVIQIATPLAFFAYNDLNYFPSQAELKPLHKCFVEILTNVSPYIKTFSMASSTKLLSMFKVYSSPKAFFSQEDHCNITLLLLELLSNCIQYQVLIYLPDNIYKVLISYKKVRREYSVSVLYYP